MLYVKWIDEKYSVNIRQIDEQHKKLIAIINEVFEKKMDNVGEGTAADILAKLTEYTQTHFQDEEKLMQQFNFPDLEVHQRTHQYFVKKVRQYVQDFRNNQEFLTDDLLCFLRDWLINHIMETDKIYATFLNKKGVF